MKNIVLINVSEFFHIIEKEESRVGNFNEITTFIDDIAITGHRIVFHTELSEGETDQYYVLPRLKNLLSKSHGLTLINDVEQTNLNKSLPEKQININDVLFALSFDICSTLRYKKHNLRVVQLW